ncbi:hypothetical protein B0J15DRAFT_463332 [Fusarium solani]|uniref:NAD(P)-binding protein n=1 Tax=Fusarium solani TaxID=169388 RepID=A0A9P9KNW7_FUSSL|nr:uncharacterized protein B0J15DRAFT_463332 [Fusarium solani]KAH7266175.1 hypothetical protein B0J15DRAFT_463332 [Fusarium solani]
MSASLFSLGSRVFSVTGGASGMGAATVRLLAQHGAGAIWIADWNDGNFGQIKEDAERINPLTKIHTHKVASIIAESGALHGAANVAGLSQPAFSEKKPAILAETNEDWARVLGVNLQGIMYCTRAQVAAMVDAPKGSHPAIVNVSSIASLLRGPSAFAYDASKAACAHFTSCVAKDIHSFGIRVNTVSPGSSSATCPRRRRNSNFKSGGVNTKMLEPEDVARVIVWLLSEASMDVNGVNLPVGEGAP